MTQVQLPFVDNETIRVTRDGVWLSNGQEITHGEQLRAFARGLGRDNEGWFIEIGRDHKRIEVEDTAYFVISLQGTAESGYTLALNDGAREPLRAETLKYREEGRLTVRISRSDREEEARFLRPDYAEILRGLEHDSSGYFVRIQGVPRRLAATAIKGP